LITLIEKIKSESFDEIPTIEMFSEPYQINIEYDDLIINRDGLERLYYKLTIYSYNPTLPQIISDKINKFISFSNYFSEPDMENPKDVVLDVKNDNEPYESLQSFYIIKIHLGILIIEIKNWLKERGVIDINLPNISEAEEVLQTNKQQDEKSHTKMEVQNKNTID